MELHLHNEARGIHRVQHRLVSPLWRSLGRTENRPHGHDQGEDRIMAKDFLENELEVGDEVVFMQKGYRVLMKGTIKRLTPKTALIVHKKANIGGTETRQEHSQIIKIKGG